MSKGRIKQPSAAPAEQCDSCGHIHGGDDPLAEVSQERDADTLRGQLAQAQVDLSIARAAISGDRAEELEVLHDIADDLGAPATGTMFDVLVRVRREVVELKKQLRMTANSRNYWEARSKRNGDRK